MGLLRQRWSDWEHLFGHLCFQFLFFLNFFDALNWLHQTGWRSTHGRVSLLGSTIRRLAIVRWLAVRWLAINWLTVNGLAITWLAIAWLSVVRLSICRLGLSVGWLLVLRLLLVLDRQRLCLRLRLTVRVDNPGLPVLVVDHLRLALRMSYVRMTVPVRCLDRLLLMWCLSLRGGSHAIG